MKKTYLLCSSIILTFTLSACSTNKEAVGKLVTTPQSLEGLNLATVNQSKPDITTDSVAPKPTTETPTPELPDLSTTDAFVDYMNTQLNTLESLYTSVIANVTLLNSTTDENMVSQFNLIKENLFNELRTTWNVIFNLGLPNDEVSKLKDYVADAYYYTIEDGNFQYEIVLNDTEDDKKDNLAVSNQISYKRNEAIRLAKEEIDRLSNYKYYSK
ncbi:MAG: hypothetical protein ACRCST_05630 [Turicibacter sp.]